MEAKALAERGASEASLSSAFNGFRREIERARERAQEAAAEMGNTPEGKALAVKILDSVVKYEKLIGRVEKGTTGRAVASAAEAKGEAAEALAGAFAFIPPDAVAGALSEVLDAQRGSVLKDFKNIEVLKTVEDRVPEVARAAIQAAKEGALTRLEEGLASEVGSRSALGDYVRATGGNEVRHLEIIQELEVRPLGNEARTAVQAAKEEVLARAEERLAEASADGKKALVEHLNEGALSDVRVVKELEKNIAVEKLGEVAEVVAAAKQEFARKIETAATDTAERARLFESVERFHDAKSLSVLDEIAALIPPEQQSIFASLKQKAAAEIQKDISRARSSEQERALYQALGGDHPEEFEAIESLGSVGSSIVEEIRAATAELIKARASVIKDQERFGKYEEALQTERERTGSIGTDELSVFFAERARVYGSREKAEAKIAEAKELVATLSGLVASLPLGVGIGEEGFDERVRSAARLLSSAERRLAVANAALKDGAFGFAYNEAQEAGFAARDGAGVARAYKSGARVPETKPPVLVENNEDGDVRLYNRYEFQKFCISFGGTLTDTLSCLYEDGRTYTVAKDAFPTVVPPAFRPVSKVVVPFPKLIVDPLDPSTLPVLDPTKSGRCGGREQFSCPTDMLCVMPENIPAVVGEASRVYGVCTSEKEVEQRKDITCQAYFEGFVYNETSKSCFKKSASGCSDPFVYKTKETCEAGARKEAEPENQRVRWVEHLWRFQDGVETSMILDRTDSEYTRYIRNIETVCRLVPRQQFVWMPGAGNDAADNWKNFGIPDCSGRAFAPANCGNNICEASETIKSCAKDCTGGIKADQAYSCPGFAHERIDTRGGRYCRLNTREACSWSYPQFLYESSYTTSSCPSATGGTDTTATTTTQFRDCASNVSAYSCEADTACDWYVPPRGSPYCSLAVRGSWVSHSWKFSDGSTETSSILARQDREYSEFIASVDAQCKTILRSKFAWKQGAGNDAPDNWQNFGIPDCSGTATGGTGTSGWAGDANSCPWFAYSRWDKDGKRYCQLNGERKCDYAYPSYLTNGPNYKDTNCPAEDTTGGGGGTATTTTGGTPQCSDGIDNDHDGKTDYPADTSCYGRDDWDEWYPSSTTGGGGTATTTTGGSCNYNNYCDPWESRALCPVECANGPGTYASGTNCNGNNYCDVWESAASCPLDCGSSAGGMPAVPTGVTATAPSTGNSVEIRWTDASTNEISFKIWRQAGGSWSMLAQVTIVSGNGPTTGTVTTYTDSTAPSGSVSYQIQACSVTTCSLDSALQTVWVAGSGGNISSCATNASLCYSQTACASAAYFWCATTNLCYATQASSPCSSTSGGGGTSTNPACSDGRDNDGDGQTDYPSDTGCYGAADTDEAYYPTGGGGGGSSTMSKCFYPNATKNGTSPGYTVWCERDYYNCRQGSESGAAVSLENLMLGAPSSCETGWSSGSSGGTVGSGCRSQTSQSSCSATSGCYWYNSGTSGAYCDSTGSSTGSTGSECSDGRDNDNDGMIDSADHGCQNGGTSETYYGSPSTSCGTGMYWSGTACVPSSSGSPSTSCGTGMYWNGTACVSSQGGSVWQAFKSWLGGE